jgi:hypothetical protein
MANKHQLYFEADGGTLSSDAGVASMYQVEITLADDRRFPCTRDPLLATLRGAYVRVSGPCGSAPTWLIRVTTADTDGDHDACHLTRISL